MSFLGKEYILVKEDNFDGFLRSAGVPDDQIAKITAFKPTHKIVKNGDNTYTAFASAPQESRECTFTVGKEFDDTVRPGEVAKVTYTIDGNTVTQVVKSDKGTVTFKKDYKGDELVETITRKDWDGVAYRYYKA